LPAAPDCDGGSASIAVAGVTAEAGAGVGTGGGDVTWSPPMREMNEFIPIGKSILSVGASLKASTTKRGITGHFGLGGGAGMDGGEGIGFCAAVGG
jgi:hypothetical protein